jgi:hypothetical protein
MLVALVRVLARRWLGTLLRFPRTLLIHMVTLLLLAGGDRRGLQPVENHSTGDGSEDQGARNQDCPDQSESVKQASHQVITNYQRRPVAERSLSLIERGEPVHVVDVAERLQGGESGLSLRLIAGERTAFRAGPA